MEKSIHLESNHKEKWEVITLGKLTEYVRSENNEVAFVLSLFMLYALLHGKLF
jgi:hypothetical protein